jgi:hypothetical protein
MCCASISNKMLCRSCHFVTASAETHKMSKKIRSCSSCSHFNSQGSQITVREGHCICTKIWKCSALWDAVVPEIAALINLLIINWIVCTLAVIVYTVKGSARSFELTNVMLITCSQHTVPPNQQELGLAIHQWWWSCWWLHQGLHCSSHSIDPTLDLDKPGLMFQNSTTSFD